MNNSFPLAPPENQQSFLYTGGNPEPPHPAGRAPHGPAARPLTALPQRPPPADPGACRWSAPPGFNGHNFGFRPHFPPPGPGLDSYGRPRPAFGYGFDPSVPPPPFSGPPPGHFPGLDPAGHGSTNSSSVGAAGVHRPAPHPGGQYGAEPGFLRQQDYTDLPDGQAAAPLDFPPPPVWGKTPEQNQGRAADPPAADQEFAQKVQDHQFIRRFLSSRNKSRAGKSPEPRRQSRVCVPGMRAALYGALRLVSDLSAACEALKRSLHSDTEWAESYTAALRLQEELQERLGALGDRETVCLLKRKLSSAAQRRERRRRRRQLREEEEEHTERKAAEREAQIDKWRMKKIQEVEEKKMEQDLKRAADSVLCEVRRKQADVKRMQDVLRSLEKLRRLRKEAASRKGIFPDREWDEAFGGRLEQLRAVARRRTELYGAEEKALRVMLEGEQEEERRRERERRLRRERERLLTRRRELLAALFGDEQPADLVLQPFRDYFTQAERSLPALLDIRRQWDAFLVAADHPDGSSLPQDWIVPAPPSDPAWASVLHSDTDTLTILTHTH
ncbi:programmed cell death protein 7 isoform X2 [Myripristis murdjan]|uniref:programmed cell death protein 7 isoform X2 n=1 Tax=Myripristis murdjan TaxID=586833 RepID=UPI001175E226|nr:programmed cell death protein 7 isoform X2 [Myripristis murdjan]